MNRIQRISVPMFLEVNSEGKTSCCETSWIKSNLIQHCWKSEVIKTKFEVKYIYIYKTVIIDYTGNYILRFIIRFQKSSTFGNLHVEKPGNWFAIAKNVQRTPEEEKNLSKTACSFTSNVTLRLVFSVSAGENQLPGFSACRISVPNGFCYTNESLLTWCIVPVKRKKMLNFLLWTIKIKYFLFFRYVKDRDLRLHQKRSFPTLTLLSVLPFL